MKLIDKIRMDRITAMKSKKELEKNLLSTLVGEACKACKEPSDEDVIATIKKFVKGINETKSALSLSIVHDIIRIKCEYEIEILNFYLPKQLNQEEIRVIIHNHNNYMMEEFGETTSLQHVMKYFKENFAGQYDGKLVSTIAKEIL